MYTYYYNMLRRFISRPDSARLSTESFLYGRRQISFDRRGSTRIMDSINKNSSTFLIGVGGGTASGKSTVCQKIMEQLGQADVSDSQRKVACIAQDSFYRQLTEAESLKASKGLFDFDHPNALDIDLIYSTLQDILNGRKTEVPVYDYVTNSRKKDEYMTIYPADVVLFEGILAFYFSQVRDLFHMKLFVDTDPDTRLSRRVMRDVSERGRDLDTVLSQYMRFVKPAFEEFCLPTKKFADVIIPRGADNLVAISLIVQHIQDLLSARNSTSKSVRVSPSSPIHIKSVEIEEPQQQEDLDSTSAAAQANKKQAKKLHRPH